MVSVQTGPVWREILSFQISGRTLFNYTGIMFSYCAVKGNLRGTRSFQLDKMWRNLHGEMFRLHAKFAIAWIPIEMNGF